jgi:hypothetical protein
MHRAPRPMRIAIRDGAQDRLMLLDARRVDGPAFPKLAPDGAAIQQLVPDETDNFGVDRVPGCRGEGEVEPAIAGSTAASVFAALRICSTEAASSARSAGVAFSAAAAAISPSMARRAVKASAPVRARYLARLPHHSVRRIPLKLRCRRSRH